MGLSIEPLPVVGLSIRVFAVPLHKLAVFPDSVISGPIREYLRALTICFALGPVASVFGPVWQNLEAHAVRLSVEPAPGVLGAIWILAHSLSYGAPFLPVAIEDGSIRERLDPLAMKSAFLPFALKALTVLPNVYT
jgi:hypothetical protein